MAAYRRVDDLRSPACTPGSAPGPTLGIKCGKPLRFYLLYTLVVKHRRWLVLTGRGGDQGCGRECKQRAYRHREDWSFRAADGRRHCQSYAVRRRTRINLCTPARTYDALSRSLFLSLYVCMCVLVHGQVTIIFVVSVCMSVCLFVQSFSQPSSIRFGSN